MGVTVSNCDCNRPQPTPDVLPEPPDAAVVPLLGDEGNFGGGVKPVAATEAGVDCALPPTVSVPVFGERLVSFAPELRESSPMISSNCCSPREFDLSASIAWELRSGTRVGCDLDERAMVTDAAIPEPLRSRSPSAGSDSEVFGGLPDREAPDAWRQDDLTSPFGTREDAILRGTCSLPSGRAVLQPGTLVRVEVVPLPRFGAGPDGVCETWDIASGCWFVRLEAGEVRRVKPDHLVAIAGNSENTEDKEVHS